jgi:hypothetical protein
MQEEIETQERTVPVEVAGWELTDSSRATLQDGSIGRVVNYEDPVRAKVFVNISQPSPVEDSELWRAKFNPHHDAEAGETIHKSEDLDEVFEAAMAWMKEHSVSSSTTLSQWSTEA